MAERRGFEPPIQFYPYNDLANRRLQPLGHLSVKPLEVPLEEVSGKDRTAVFRARLLRGGERLVLPQRGSIGF